jgi:DNA repair exonuclease SbcCD ATPase subunit
LKAPVQDALNALNIARDTLSRLANAKAASDKAKMRCVELKMSIQASEKRAALLRHAVAVTGRSGFMSEIFDEILSEIEVRANDLMVYMPNVSTYSMVISSVSSTKAGAIKKTISTKVLRNTGQEVDPKDLSGGQQCSIELSTDLAVAEAIRARSGSPLGWIALDEAMDGLDVEPKKAAIEAIRQKTRGLVIIIDHATEIKESFDSVIQIEYDGKESRVL